MPFTQVVGRDLPYARWRWSSVLGSIRVLGRPNSKPSSRRP